MRSDAFDPWIWQDDVISQYGFSKDTILRWREGGCPWISEPGAGLAKLKSQLRPGANKERVYLLKEQVDAIHEAIQVGGGGCVGPPGPEWMWHDEAGKKYGMSRQFLLRYCDEPHPLIHRKIRTKLFPVADGGRTTWRRYYFVRDLEELHEKRGADAAVNAWISAPTASDEFGLNNATLNYWRENGCPYLNGKKPSAKKQPILRRGGLPLDVWHYLRKDLEQIRARRSERPGNRSFADADGMWRPQFEAMQIAGVTAGHLEAWREKPCPALGRVLRAKQMPLYLYRSKHGPLAWVYHDEDLRAIARKRNGHPEPTAAGSIETLTVRELHVTGKAEFPQTAPKRAGRPVDADTPRDRYRRIISEWAKAKGHTDKKTFIVDRRREFPGLSLKELDRARKWVDKYGISAGTNSSHKTAN